MCRLVDSCHINGEQTMQQHGGDIKAAFKPLNLKPSVNPKP